MGVDLRSGSALVNLFGEGLDLRLTQSNLLGVFLLNEFHLFDISGYLDHGVLDVVVEDLCFL